MLRCDIDEALKDDWIKGKSKDNLIRTKMLANYRVYYLYGVEGVKKLLFFFL